MGVPLTEAERELYCLLDRDPPSQEEWLMLQRRWSAIFRPAMAGQPGADPEGYDLSHLDGNLHQQMRG